MSLVAFPQLCARCGRPSSRSVCRKCRRALHRRTLAALSHTDAPREPRPIPVHLDDCVRNRPDWSGLSPCCDTARHHRLRDELSYADLADIIGLGSPGRTYVRPGLWRRLTIWLRCKWFGCQSECWKREVPADA